MSAGPSFEALVSLLRRSSEGCLIESFVRVEHGEDYLRAAWDAFNDMREASNALNPDWQAALNDFVAMLSEDVDLAAIANFPAAGQP